jgi:hypothetical protein
MAARLPEAVTAYWGSTKPGDKAFEKANGTVALDSITLDPNNTRDHTGEKGRLALRGSLARFGQRKPIVLDKDGIVRAGNGLATCAIELGWKRVWAVRFSDLDGHEAALYRDADNRTAELSVWDFDALRSEYRSMLDAGAVSLEELDALGWSKDDLDPLFAGEWEEPGGDNVDVPDPEDKDNVYSIRVNGVKPADKEEILAAVKKALKGTEYDVAAY